MGKKVDYEKLKEIRVKKGLTQLELSDRTGINLTTIKYLETGRSITTDENMKMISEVLEIEFDEIVNEDFRETKVIAVTNNKGGSGKTSVVASLGYCLSEMDKKVLLIDSDMQMNLSFSYGFGQDPEKNLNHALTKEIDLDQFEANVSEVRVKTLQVENNTALSASNKDQAQAFAGQSEQWATGTEPGGVGTKSSREWAESAPKWEALTQAQYDALSPPDPEILYLIIE